MNLPLVGRDQEVAALYEVLRATRAGVGGATVLTGPPGIGKTRLLAEVRGYAERLGLSVAAGQSIELDQVAPLTTMVAALRETCPEPIDLSALRQSTGDRLWGVERLGEVLEEYVARRPLVVILDDAHWADELSALALRMLVPRLSSSPVHWLVARRPRSRESRAQDAIDWLVGEGARELVLAPLSDAAVTSLCANVLGVPVDATVLALAEQGRGNPFLVEQYLTALKDTDQVLVSDGVASVVGADLPESFLAAVDQRLRGLSPEARRLLQAGAVFGRPFTLHAAARLVGRAAAALGPAAEEAVAAGVLDGADVRLAFRHDLLRQAVYNRIAEPVRAAMHRDAAGYLSETGRPAVEVAEHLMLAGPAGGREAVAVLRAAAEQVAAQAPATAAELMLRAWELSGVQDGLRPSLGAAAVGLLAAAGRIAQARELGEQTLAAGRLDPATEAMLLVGLAEALKYAGQNRAAADYAARGLSDPGVPVELRAKLHAVHAHALIYVNELAGADAAGAEADRLGQRNGQPAAAVWGAAARSVVANAAGRLDAALGYARHAVDVADRAGGAALQRHPRIWLGAVLAALDRFDEAEAVYTTGRRTADRLGTAWSQPLWHYYNASLNIARGRLDEAVAEAQAGLRLAEQLSALHLSIPLLGLLTRLAVLQGGEGEAHGYAQRLGLRLADGESAAPEDVNWSIAYVQAADRQYELACNTLTGLYDPLPERLLLFSTEPGAAAELVRIAVQAGEPARAEQAVAGARLLAERNPDVSSLAAAADHAEGLYRNELSLLRRSVDRFRDSPRPLDRVGALEDTANAELAAGNRGPAVALYQQAIEEASSCGAHRAVTRIEKRLNAQGVRHRAGPARPAGPLANLTATELAIARMIARGLTNKQIAEEINRSPHTVDSHIRNIFAKTGVNSRSVLSALVGPAP